MLKLLLSSISLLLFTTVCYSQNNKQTLTRKFKNQDTLVVTDTLVVYDTISIPKKTKETSTNITATTDSIPKVRKNQENFIQRTIKFNGYSFSVADYMEIALNSRWNIKRFFCTLGIGLNINKQVPAIINIGAGYNIPLGNKLTFRPSISGLLYLPLSLDFGTTNYNHIKLGFCYKLSKKLALSLEPSAYYSPKSSITDDEHYSNILAFVSPIKPLYTEKTGTTKRYDIGFGLSLGLEFISQ